MNNKKSFVEVSCPTCRLRRHRYDILDLDLVHTCNPFDPTFGSLQDDNAINVYVHVP